MIRLQRIWENDKPKLSYYLDELGKQKFETKPRVLLIFWHGLGDGVMFLNVFDHLKILYPNVILDLAVQKGLGFEELFCDLGNTNVIYIDGSFFSDLPIGQYEIIADIDFPMNEGQVELTKGEWCCVHELGIDPVNGHKLLTQGVNRLIGVHFNITCLPDSCNPDRDTAERIWNDILSCGFIPIETHFQHVFHNPVNAKFDFVDCTVRRVHPRISTLLGLLKQCAGFVGVVSGNLHCALSVLPHERIFFLDKDFHLGSFTKDADKIAKANLRNYNGEVKEWLKSLPEYPSS
jgi:hypothetical protein